MGILIAVLIMVVMGGIIGWLAGLIVKGSGYGLLGDVIIGIVGANIAGFLLPALGISLGGSMVGSIIASVIGAVILLLVIRLIRRAA
ncbi:MAG: GlsB/YeaQ/YmgE family stress response membrane protein [Nitratireductor sp.]|nr:GlsB/YeaQ/YmgE family stress response membrane protein [Nitratireductor sp.]